MPNNKMKTVVPNLREVKEGDAMKAADPDFSRLRTVLLRQGEPDRIPFYELFADQEIMEAVLGKSLPDSPEGYWKGVIQFYYQLGYDYVPVPVQIGLAHDNVLFGQDTAELARPGEGNCAGLCPWRRIRTGHRQQCGQLHPGQKLPGHAG